MEMTKALAKQKAPPERLSKGREPIPELGPAMRVLPKRWRVAVLALFDTKGDRTMALRLAGYRSKQESLHVIASRVFADTRVRLAIREECVARIDGAEPELIAVVRGIMPDLIEKATDRPRAASWLWARPN